MPIALRIRGLVQGVGFRPTVWRLAQQLHLSGDVRNDGDGVLVRFANDDEQMLERFCALLEKELPPLARIDSLQSFSIQDALTSEHFEIIDSAPTTPLTGIVPDAATCPACQKELFDPCNRRYRYPFINCTHCGPRLSIIRAIPYDRANTSMDVFPMCAPCLSEYRSPADRRYHAQPNACSDCGPHIWLDDEPDADTFQRAEQHLRHGDIVAIKGIGGFHLACDAHNAQSVERLRERKHRYGKPFALMAKDIDTIKRYCELNTAAIELLQSPAAPIVLLPRKDNAPVLPDAIAETHQTLGFMLPYSPIHHLLLQNWDTPLVMTSGNISDEPQCIGNREAAERLKHIADHVLLHDRDIINRVDDSVVRIMADRPRLYRRARGYAPAPIVLHESFANASKVLALGSELKNTLCLLQQGNAIVSQHLGDLEDTRTSDEFERTLHLYQHLYDFKPQAIVVDRHPDYRSTRIGHDLAMQQDLQLIEVQHHHAHIVSVMAERGLAMDCPPVLGIALDGLGYGEDNTLWGGEFLKADYRQQQRLAHLSPFPMPGGSKAIIEPWRNLWAQLYANQQLELLSTFETLPINQWLSEQPLQVLQAMAEKGVNTPSTSSAGRLFDAVAAALCLHHQGIHQEGQAAIALEQLAAQADADCGDYPITLDSTPSPATISTHKLWPALFADLHQGIEKKQIARRFHNGFVNALLTTAHKLLQQHAMDTVVLSGGVFQNQIVLEGVINGLQQSGYQVLHHEAVPTNDGGLSLGQAAIAAARLTNRP